MPRQFKILLLAAWALLMLATTSMLAALYLHNRSSHELQLIAPAPQFTLSDQNGKAITQADLRGQPYIVDLIFTRCGSVCPVMTSKMARLQKDLRGTAIRFVSVTVDPEYDTPPVLKQYAEIHRADESNWLFLTGPQKSIEQLARGFMLVYEPASADEPIMHSDRFLLVDKSGNIRGVYQSKEPTDLTRLVNDAKSLAENAL